ncbi:MAG TPA: nicotinate phosphoribosyltransferase [Aquifex aeolicus]|uniref:Nicotinate phosphoribosyltransferase n=1 Tax=Aquifex aeolicus TaxID=63363 RepID=A0A9D1CEN5_AQUAO|nr:nicotinate phosphoribosyltransferase [Aquificales bacterium]HIP98065.1 nicotinate phosphoribosyltransferase [Aquifex aeolicus]HIQ26741.1 nicotinate phosphoribosyltransferase [Aquifex aeolicus]
MEAVKPHGLKTDLYELTMAQVYLQKGKTDKAVFSLYVRKLPEERNFLVSGGVERLVNQLGEFRFSKELLKFLKSLNLFKDWFLDWLEEFEFNGNIYAIPDGRIIFEEEPIVQVEADLPTAQILETFIINILHLETVLNSKAGRIYAAAKGKILVDFGYRRALGFEAGNIASKSALICGWNATSNVEAGYLYGLPLSGTMAHSYIMVFGEEEAFKEFYKTYPQKAIYLIDTYDVIKGAKLTVKLAKEGYKPIGVRIDSGDIPTLVREVRKLLNRYGLSDIKIIVSGGVDEYKIHQWGPLPIDGYGVGTKFSTSADRPYLDMAYKLVEYGGKPTFKLSEGKKTYPFKKQVFRFYNPNGRMDYDFVTFYGKQAEGEPLIVEVVKEGKPVKDLGNWKQARERFLSDFEKLPERLKGVQKEHYEVQIDARLEPERFI